MSEAAASAPYLQRFSKLERISVGRPAAEAVAAEAARAGAERVLLLTNRSLAREAAFLDGIAAALASRLIGRIADLSALSPAEDVLRVAAAARAARADLLVAVGGGSVIDTAKLVVVSLAEDRTTRAALAALPPYAEVDQSVLPRAVLATAVRFVAVPTTLSSAEFNWGASFLDTATGVKYAVGHALMAPQAVVLDPRATLTAPEALILGTGMKAIDHAAERLASHLGNPVSDAAAHEALALLGRALRRIRHDPGDLAARLDAQTGTWLSVAGQSAGVPVGASHPIGRNLSALAGVPHGLTACMILPAVLRWNAAVNAPRQQRVAAALGMPGLAADAAVAALVADLGLPGRLRDLGVARALFAEIARKTIGERAIGTNPRPIRTPEDIVEILELAW